MQPLPSLSWLIMSSWTFLIFQTSGSQPVGPDPSGGQMTLTQVSSKTFQKHVYLHDTSWQYQNYSNEVRSSNQKEIVWLGVSTTWETILKDCSTSLGRKSEDHWSKPSLQADEVRTNWYITHRKSFSMFIYPTS